MLWTSNYNTTIEEDDAPAVNITINGENTEGTTGDFIPLDPGGRYDVGLNASFGTYQRATHVALYDIVYRPLENITRIRDIIPEALVETYRGSPPQSNGLGCAAQDSESGAAPHLRENTGGLLLLPMMFVWYALR